MPAAHPRRERGHHHRGVRRRHRRRSRAGRPAVQAADRRLRRAVAQHAVRPRARAAGDRLSGRAPGRTERGAVTAELAMVLPLLVAVTVGLAWLLGRRRRPGAHRRRRPRDGPGGGARGRPTSRRRGAGAGSRPTGTRFTVTRGRRSGVRRPRVPRSRGPGGAARRLLRAGHGARRGGGAAGAVRRGPVRWPSAARRRCRPSPVRGACLASCCWSGWRWAVVGGAGAPATVGRRRRPTSPHWPAPQPPARCRRVRGRGAESPRPTGAGFCAVRRPRARRLVEVTVPGRAGSACAADLRGRGARRAGLTVDARGA